MLLDPRNGPEWDLPRSDAPVRTYVIASTPRTGSTLLANALWDTGVAAAPKEYCNPMQIRDFAVRFGSIGERLRHDPLIGPAVGLAGVTFDGAAMRRHLRGVLAVRTAADGLFGLKLHHHHFARWWDDVVPLLGDVTWVHVSRRDRLAQAVSWEKALQTGQWASFQRSWLRPRYSRRRIQARLDAIERAEHGWEAFLAPRDPLRVVYEDLVDLGTSVDRVLSRLGRARTSPTPAPSLMRQADVVTADWILRFRTA